MTISDYMRADHARLRALLRAGDFERFRGGLLRHIGLEEKILLPSLRAAGADPVELAKTLRADHGILATLLVPTPTPEITSAIVRLLDVHDVLEEGTGGLYELCDAKVDAAVVERMEAVREPPLAPHFDGPRAQDKLRDALAYVKRRVSPSEC